MSRSKYPLAKNETPEGDVIGARPDEIVGHLASPEDRQVGISAKLVYEVNASEPHPAGRDWYGMAEFDDGDFAGGYFATRAQAEAWVRDTAGFAS